MLFISFLAKKSITLDGRGQLRCLIRNRSFWCPYIASFAYVVSRDYNKGKRSDIWYVWNGGFAIVLNDPVMIMSASFKFVWFLLVTSLFPFIFQLKRWLLPNGAQQPRTFFILPNQVFFLKNEKWKMNRQLRKDVRRKWGSATCSGVTDGYEPNLSMHTVMDTFQYSNVIHTMEKTVFIDY